MYENLDDAFRDLESKKYYSMAGELAAYRDALMAKGFTRREALRIVERFAELVHENIIDDVTIGRRINEIGKDLADIDDDLDDPPTAS